MNEILFKAGFALAILFFISSVFFFIYFRIPSVVKYLLKMNNKRIPKHIVENQKQRRKKARDKSLSTSLNKSPKKTANKLSGGKTELHTGEQTELLDMMGSDATTILDFNNRK